jgi:hypothetical protein
MEKISSLQKILILPHYESKEWMNYSIFPYLTNYPEDIRLLEKIDTISESSIKKTM